MRKLLLYFLLLPFFESYTQVTYYDDIAPVIHSHCISCHSPGQIGPMPLTNYEEVSSYASMIKFVTDIGLMPPFKADTHKVKYANERSISEEERRIFSEWINGGLVEGVENKDVKKKPNVVITSLYDYSACMEESFEHYGIYYDQYQAFTIPLDSSIQHYVKEIIFEPGNSEIVRSASISIAPRGASKKQDEWDPRYGFFSYGNTEVTSSFPNWYNWMPYSKTNELKHNEYQYIPQNSELIMHLHYGPFGTVQKDSSCVHFIFEDTIRSILQNVPLIQTQFLKDTFVLEKNKKHRINSSFILPVDVELRSITPLSHLICRQWSVFAVLPNHNSKVLVEIDDWDFHWKEKFVFEEALTLPAGTKIVASAIYDNTNANPFNPATPPHTMKKGPHMYDENFECYFEFASSKNTLGLIIKPFIETTEKLNHLEFKIEEQAKIDIVIYSLESGGREVIKSHSYTTGNHTLKSSKLPKEAGRYCITLESQETVLDQWWLIISEE